MENIESRMEKTRDYTELVVWKKAHEFVLCVYQVTKNFPREEFYGLTLQFRRAAVSIAANIAEGYGKTSKAEKLRFLNIAQGSLKECSYYLILSKDLKYINNYVELELLLNDVAKLIKAYIQAISKSME